MDIFTITKLSADMANKIKDKYETSHFVGSEMYVGGMPTPTMMEYNEIYKPVIVKTNTVKLSDILSFILGVVIGIYAAYLSWQCNTAMNYSTFLKVIFAIFAYIFGLVYLILYLVMRYDTCKVIGKKK